MGAAACVLAVQLAAAAAHRQLADSGVIVPLATEPAHSLTQALGLGNGQRMVPASILPRLPQPTVALAIRQSLFRLAPLGTTLAYKSRLQPLHINHDVYYHPQVHGPGPSRRSAQLPPRRRLWRGGHRPSGGQGRRRGGRRVGQAPGNAGAQAVQVQNIMVGFCFFCLVLSLSFVLVLFFVFDLVLFCSLYYFALVCIWQLMCAGQAPGHPSAQAVQVEPQTTSLVPYSFVCCPCLSPTWYARK